MAEMGGWQLLLLGVLMVLVLLWAVPGARSAIERSRASGERDWAGFLLPLALVALFVMAMIAMV